MLQQTGDGLLKLFEKLNIETGNINPPVIKAWFDTDCEHLLKWICASITEENYISPQENNEFLNIENILTGRELDNELKSVEAEYPDIFNYDLNTFEIEIAQDKLEILEEQLEDCDNQIKINQILHHNLSKELSKLRSDEIKTHIEKESAQDNCQKLSKKLDEINSKSYDQILKYHTYLSNYEFATVPTFINHIDLTELEEQFLDIVTCVDAAIKIDSDLLNTSVEKNFVNILSELKNRIFQSNLNYMVLQMESEALNNTLKFLENYDVHAHLSLADCDSIQLNIEYNKSQQNYMLKMIEESSLKQAELHISQPTIKCSQNELTFYRSKLNYLNLVEHGFIKILSHLAVMYNLYVQEKTDISSSSQFFKNVMQYVSQDLETSDFRRNTMLKVINEFKKFNTSPVENKFKLIGNFGKLLSKDGQQPLVKILEKTKSMRNEIEILEKRYFNQISKNFEIPRNVIYNKEILYNFLTCGPTCRIVVIPHNLQWLLNDIDANLDAQNSSVKAVMQMIQKSKDSISSNRLKQH